MQTLDGVLLTTTLIELLRIHKREMKLLQGKDKNENDIIMILFLSLLEISDYSCFKLFQILVFSFWFQK